MSTKEISIEEGKTTWRDVFVQYRANITDEEIDYILWNETCYPFSDKITLTQIKTYFDNTIEQSKNLKA